MRTGIFDNVAKILQTLQVGVPLTRRGQRPNAVTRNKATRGTVKKATMPLNSVGWVQEYPSTESKARWR